MSEPVPVRGDAGRRRRAAGLPVSAPSAPGAGESGSGSGSRSSVGEPGAAGASPGRNDRGSGRPRRPDSPLRRIARRVGPRGFLVAGVLVAVAVRIPLLPQVSRDMWQIGGWFDFIVENGYFAALRYDFSNHNVPYLYLQTLLAFSAPWLPTVWAVKTISIVFDFVLAFFVGKCVALRYPDSKWIPKAAAVTVLLLPSVVLNSSWWGQTDSIYTAFLAACLYFLLAGKQRRAFVAFGLAFAAKLQAVFLAPLFLWLAVKKAVDWRSFCWSPLTWFVTLLPAWFLGRPLGDLLTIYLDQASTQLALTNRAQNLYQYLPDRFLTLFPLFLALAVAVFPAIAVAIHRSRRRLTPERIVLLSTLTVLLAPYLLPKMHDRYFFAAEVFAVLLAFRSPRYWYAPVVLHLASLNVYTRALLYHWPVPPSWLAVPLGLLILVLARDFRSEPAGEGPPGVRPGRFGRLRSGFFAPARSRFLPGALALATLAILSVGAVRWAPARRSETAQLEAVRRSVRSGRLDPPLLRSTFDLYLDGERLVYLREPCAPADTEALFLLFLHPPEDPDPETEAQIRQIRSRASPSDRDPLTRYFIFEELGRRLDGACIAAVPLPESGLSGIAAVEVGQWDGSRRTWSAVRRVDRARFRSVRDSIAAGAAGEPLVRSVFDLYRVGSELAYHRKPCAPEEVESRFFLHLFPPEEPARRGGQRSFENRDFDFEERGLELDDECLALVPLPAEGIAAARTGQWAAGEPPFWEAAVRLDGDRFRARLEAIAAGGEPLVRSNFDLYLGETELLYHRERCAAADVEGRFFVHLAPTARVPREGMDAFGSHRFSFGERGVRTDDGQCLAIFPLDRQKIASIDTGQRRDGAPLWRTRLRLEPDGRVAPPGSTDPAPPGEPDFRSVFDLHYDGTTLTYHKEPCSADDTSARFFLHVVPADQAVLPADAARFENRDFAFPDYGLHLDGACTARVPLPPYAIAHLRTGQFVSGGGRLWEATLSPGDGPGSD